MREALETIDASDFAPPDKQVAFDVHNFRAGTSYENLDVIAVHWRTEQIIEVIAVEVKLDVSAALVQQACNDQRFAHRAWFAVPVNAPAAEAALSLRESDPRLFELVSDVGLGILGCHRRQGRSYAVFPLHWARLGALDRVERSEFVERHRTVFEEAGVVAPRQDGFPKIA